MIKNARIIMNADVNVKKCVAKGKCDDGFLWNPSACEFELDKLSDVGEYLDCMKSKGRKRLVDKL